MEKEPPITFPKILLVIIALTDGVAIRCATGCFGS